jgi:hypothetical protein
MKVGDLVQEVSSNRNGVVMGLPKEQRYLCVKPHPFYTVLWSDGKTERVHVNNLKVIA